MGITNTELLVLALAAPTGNLYESLKVRVAWLLSAKDPDAVNYAAGDVLAVLVWMAKEGNKTLSDCFGETTQNLPGDHSLGEYVETMGDRLRQPAVYLADLIGYAAIEVEQMTGIAVEDCLESWLRLQAVKLFDAWGKSDGKEFFEYRISAPNETIAIAAAHLLEPTAKPQDVKVGRSTDLPPARYLAALERMQGFVSSGEELVYYDDTTPGNHELHCSWGLCSVRAEHWPDPADHLWPDQFAGHQRVAPLHRSAKDGHRCPMDRRDRAAVASDPNGCFYTCRFFQKGKNPTRLEALDLYDQAIVEQEDSGQPAAGVGIRDGIAIALGQEA